jgi:hypothetical protein
MTVADSIKAELDEAQFVIQQQIERIAELKAEVERLKAGLDAHGTLRLIYTNPNSPEGNRIKAAAAALPVEKPKLMSVVPSVEDRRERWRAYQRYELKKQILIESRALPAPDTGWDAHLVGDTYQPPKEGEPPMDIGGKDAIKAHVMLSDLLD